MNLECGDFDKSHENYYYSTNNNEQTTTGKDFDPQSGGELN